MTRPEEPFEAASYDLNKFRERRLADRRFQPRDTADRRSNVTDIRGDREAPEPPSGDNSAGAGRLS